ncbi:MAG: cysteine--tRNA ligase [Candidatus Omnitrophica bacterium]|nr:cysteine--tRNA ligase [Candidatus Omnitrophota bacterium]
MHIYNSLSRKKEEFTSLKPKEVKMYACGPTVYDEPHIGHARSAYIFDVIRRYLIYKGYKVKFVRNVTDVDDKIINKAKEEFPGENLNLSFKKVAEKYLTSYHQALADLGIDSGQDIKEPKASEYIKQMQKFIQILIDKDAAYPVAGDVYFDITKAKNYGKLSNQSLEKMESGARVAPHENKRNPLDFALWKSAKENEPAWDSPWGKGRPGWHIECSVMSSDILGDTFDIHGGGIDLIFPHHENEIAQSEAAGEKFARYWIHHGLLTINGQKMAKSLGNFITVKDFIDKYKDPNLLKLLFLSTHYSHPVDFTDEKIEEAKKVYERLFIMLNKVHNIFNNLTFDQKERIKSTEQDNQFGYIRSHFEEAMEDDFNTPQALAVLQGLITDTNVIITEYPQITGKDISLKQLYYSCYILLPKLADVFGLVLDSIVVDIGGYLDEEVRDLIEKRNKARKNKNFDLSDKIRIELEKNGIILEDTKDGTTWRRKL